MSEREIAYQEDREEETLRRVTDTEKRIQRLLLDLQEEIGWRIDQVNVDTRNFANCMVEIFFDLRKG